MGIPGFYGRWLVPKAFKGVLWRGFPGRVSSLSFDLNGMIHQVRLEVWPQNNPKLAAIVAETDPHLMEVRFYEKLNTTLMNNITAIGPNDTLIIAIDGVAPMAKIQQQRQRRYKAASARKPKEFDSNAITPGTEFMARLDNFLQSWIVKNRPILPPKVIYSGPNTAGEGEHKIMDLYRRGEVSTGREDEGYHVLYGLDADLIMLAMLAPVERIILTREDIRDNVQIDNLREAIGNLLATESAIPDFVLMMYLTGNDFLPHGPALGNLNESIDAMIAIYQSLRLPLTQEVEAETFTLALQGGPSEPEVHLEIHWANFARFLQALVPVEQQLLAVASVTEVTYPSRFLKASLNQGKFYPEKFRTLWYQNELGAQNLETADLVLQLINRYAPPAPVMTPEGIAIPQMVTGPLFPVTVEAVRDMVQHYLTGLAWTLIYYTEGTAAVNGDWYYPYLHSPMIIDMPLIVQSLTTPPAIWAAAQKIVYSPAHQLMAVIPLQSRELIQPEFRTLMGIHQGRFSPITDLFPLDFIVELDGVNDVSRGIAILPPADRKRIYDAVNQIQLMPERAEILRRLWQPRDHTLYEYSPEEAGFHREQRIVAQQLAERRATQGYGRGRGGFGRGGFGRGGRGFGRGEGRGRAEGRGFGRGRGEEGRGRGGFEQGGRGRGFGRGEGRGFTPRTPERTARREPLVPPANPVMAPVVPLTGPMAPAVSTGLFAPPTQPGQPVRMASVVPVAGPFAQPTQPVQQLPTPAAARSPQRQAQPPARSQARTPPRRGQRGTRAIIGGAQQPPPAGTQTLPPRVTAEQNRIDQWSSQPPVL
jgi:hypothetical protein